MHWNHRLIKRLNNGEEELYIVEIYYENGSIVGWSEQEVVWGTTVDEVKTLLEWMTEALSKPVLDEARLLQLAEEKQAESG